MFTLFSASESSPERLRRIERKLDLILAHLGIDPADAEPGGPWKALADQGDKIGAIRAYRKATGADLAGAKEAVERHLASR